MPEGTGAGTFGSFPAGRDEAIVDGGTEAGGALGFEGGAMETALAAAVESAAVESASDGSSPVS